MLGSVTQLDIESVVPLLELKDSFEFDYLDTSVITRVGEQMLSTKHYPLTVNFKTESEIDLGEAINRVVDTLNHHMKEVGEGFVYFSPAAMFSTINTTAKSIYAFKYYDAKNDQYEVKVETNFLVIPKEK